MKVRLAKPGKISKKAFPENPAEPRARNVSRQIIPVRKKRRLKYIAVLPSLVTLINALCGFIAIVLASRSPVFTWNLFFMRDSSMTSLTLAGYMIILAMIADMLDGRLARLTRSTSSFGGQLDSLSDAISFGIAPAFLTLKLVESHIERLMADSSGYPLFIGRVVFFTAIFYAMCAVIRLARFNVENEEDEMAHMNFTGLPTPAAAGVVVSLLLYHQQILLRFPDESSGIFHIFELITVSAFPVITLLTGILMVSRIRYPHLANQLFRGKKTLPGFLAIFAAGLLSVWNIQLVLVIGFCSFALFGVAKWIITSLPKKKETAKENEST